MQALIFTSKMEVDIMKGRLSFMLKDYYHKTKHVYSHLTYITN